MTMQRFLFGLGLLVLAFGVGAESALHAQPASAVQQAAPVPPAPTSAQLAIQAASRKRSPAHDGSVGHQGTAGRRQRQANGPNPANYDESKADVYPNLPDPLVLKNGQPVTTADDLVEPTAA